MSRDDLIEKVALESWHVWHGTDPWDGESEDVRDDWRRVAKAALSVIEGENERLREGRTTSISAAEKEREGGGDRALLIRVLEESPQLEGGGWRVSRGLAADIEAHLGDEYDWQHPGREGDVIEKLRERLTEELEEAEKYPAAKATTALWRLRAFLNELESTQGEKR